MPILSIAKLIVQDIITLGPSPGSLHRRRGGDKAVRPSVHADAGQDKGGVGAPRPALRHPPQQQGEQGT